MTEITRRDSLASHATLALGQAGNAQRFLASALTMMVYGSPDTVLRSEIAGAIRELNNAVDTLRAALPRVEDQQEGAHCWKIEDFTVSGYMAAIAGKAARDIVLERMRQITVEGWTPEHDDEHAEYEMAKAAGCYAWIAGQSDKVRLAFDAPPPPSWPWVKRWWKPKNRRRDLVKAGALILAEIERIDRAERRALGGGAV